MVILVCQLELSKLNIFGHCVILFNCYMPKNLLCQGKSRKGDAQTMFKWLKVLSLANKQFNEECYFLLTGQI